MVSPRRRGGVVSRFLAVSALAAGSAAALPGGAAAAADADPGIGHTSWSTYAEWGHDATGGGTDAFTPADSVISAAGDSQAVEIDVHQGGALVAAARFDAGDGNVLTQGQTVADVGYSLIPAVSVTAGRDCGSGELGGFTVHEVAFADGRLSRFSATFSHTCAASEAGGDLFGSVAWQADAAAPPVPNVAGVAPEPVHSLEVDLGYQGIGLEWANPATPDWSATIVRGAVGTNAPATPADGFAVYSGRRDGAAMNIARPGTTYTFSVFSKDTEGLVSARRTVRVNGVRATLSVSRATVDYFSSATLSGRLVDAVTGSALGDRTVEVLCRRPGDVRWFFVDSAVTDSGGRFSLPIGPAATYDFWVFYRPEGVSDKTHGGGVAGPVRVTVTMGVDVEVDRSTGRLGSTFSVGTVVGPTSAGSQVLLQRLVDGQWKTVQKGTLRASRPTYFDVKPTTRGSHSFRIYKAGDAERSAGVSRTVKIRVT